VQNAPDEASRQLRSFVGAALQVAASSFDLADLVNTDPRKVQLDAFEAHLRDQVAAQVRAIYGVEIRQVGIERLSLPAETLAATVERMRAERETVAAERTAEGLRAAAAIRADAARDERVTVAHAEATAADIEAAAEQRAAELHASAYKADPGLYLLLRSLDSIGQVVNGSTRLILRTDAAPFNMLVSGVPPSPPAPPPPVPTPVPGPPGQVMSGTPPSGGPR
jgi:membrane protease subunit HflC